MAEVAARGLIIRAGWGGCRPQLGVVMPASCEASLHFPNAGPNGQRRSRFCAGGSVLAPSLSTILVAEHGIGAVDQASK